MSGGGFMLKDGKINLAKVGVNLLLVVLGVYLVLRFRQELLTILTPFFLALLLSYLLDPLVNLFECRQIPRAFSILLVYVIFLTFILVIALRFIPGLIEDLQNLILKLPDYSLRFQNFINHLQTDYQRFNLPPAAREVIDENIQALLNSVTSQLNRLTEYLISIFTQIFMLILAPILAYYILLDEQRLKNKFLQLIPKRFRYSTILMFGELDRSLGAYLRGIVIVSVLVGFMTYLGLFFLQVDFALFLGMLNGLTNLIPFFGPLIGAVPTIAIAFLDSPALALRVLILVIIVQQVENQLIAPQILGRSLGFHPLFVIFVLLLGGHIAGLLGLLFALPLATVIRIFIKHFLAVKWRGSPE